MIKYFICALIAVFFVSCGQNTSFSQESRDQYTLEQLDSIGRAFVPNIGNRGGTINLILAATPTDLHPRLQVRDILWKFWALFLRDL